MMSSRPVVTATDACFGSRPVANALGAGSVTMYTFGIGRPPAMQRPSITLYKRLYCWGSASCARLTARATLSLYQYDPKAITPERIRAATVPIVP